jgi:hypothetical protein
MLCVKGAVSAALILPLCGEVDARSASGWGSEFVATSCPNERPPPLTPPHNGEGNRRSSRLAHVTAYAHVEFIFLQPPAFSRRVCVRVLKMCAPKREGRAERRGPDGPAGLIASQRSGGTMLFDEAPSGNSASRHFSGVPRAMFEACSARPPVVLPFQAPSFSFAQEKSLTTAKEPGLAGAMWHRVRNGHHDPVTRGWRAGTVRLRLPGGVYVFAARPPATAPCPSLVTFARLPLDRTG